MLLIVLALVAVTVITVGFAYAAASPAVCATCHSMEPAVEAWRVSGHSKVGCPSCHEEPREWYEFPQTLGDRASLLARDVGLHLSGQTATEEAPHERMSSDITDDICSRCHVPGREISIRYGTLIDHEEHAERNESCVSCHVDTGHPDPEAERWMLMMRQCFECHGRDENAEAPGECDVCHPSDFDLAPVSHQEDVWQAEHGPVALTGNEDCIMCHDQRECADCHGLEMPHPGDWVEQTSTHTDVVAADPDVCTNCHTPLPDFCADCHHEGYDSAAGSWLDQHQEIVRERGAAYCFECHDAAFCVRCHSTSPPTEPGERP